jgi:hypothetical protein
LLERSGDIAEKGLGGIMKKRFELEARCYLTNQDTVFCDGVETAALTGIAAYVSEAVRDVIDRSTR